MTLTPAFGKAYMSSAGVLSDWHRGVPFLAPKLREYRSKATVKAGTRITFLWVTELGEHRCFFKA